MKESSLNNGFTRLAKLNPNFIYKPWYFDTLISKVEFKKNSLYTDNFKMNTYQGFDPSKILGTTHSSYYKKT